MAHVLGGAFVYAQGGPGNKLTGTRHCALGLANASLFYLMEPRVNFHIKPHRASQCDPG